MANYVKAVVCGVTIERMLVMTSKFDGYDTHTKQKFRQGSQIAYKPKDQLTPEQKAAIFPNGKIYNVCVQWPMGEAGVAGVAGKPTNSLANKVEFTPSKYQESILDTLLNSTDHMLIEALAGSGKTSTLVWLLQELHLRGLSAGMSIVYLAFNKSIQEELSEKLQGTNVPAMTTHSFGFSLLKKRFGYDLNISKSRSSDIFIKLLCDDCKFTYSPAAFKVVRNEEQYKLRPAVLELVSYVKNWGIFPIQEDGKIFFSEEDDATIHQFIEMYEVEYDREKFKEDLLVDYVKRVVIASIPQPDEELSCIEFDDMLYLVHALNLPMPYYDLVLTDESQDFNLCQIKLLEKLANAEK